MSGVEVVKVSGVHSKKIQGHYPGLRRFRFFFGFFLDLYTDTEKPSTPYPPGLCFPNLPLGVYVVKEEKCHTTLRSARDTVYGVLLLGGVT